MRKVKEKGSGGGGVIQQTQRMRPSTRRYAVRMTRRVDVMGIVFAMSLVGCSQGSSTTASPSSGPQDGSRTSTTVPAPFATTTAVPIPSVIATAKVPRVEVFDSPTSTSSSLSLANPSDDGSRRYFLVKEQRQGWIEVFLPVRPNGRTGWIRTADVTTETTPYRIKVELSVRRITVWNASQIVDQESVAIGSPTEPTPVGQFYITAAFRFPTESQYGAYRLVLSAFPAVETAGPIAIQGTNDPSSIGKEVSKGEVRMSNAGITLVANMLLIGTPVEIVR